METNELILRTMLWIRHGCPLGALYGDDGEMQCNVCHIDFVRDSAEQIHNRFYEISMQKLIDTGTIQLLKEGTNDHSTG